jgi:hypothetical protein
LYLSSPSGRCCYHSNIFREAKQMPIFRDFALLSHAFIDGTAAVPESPLFFSTSHLKTIANERLCSRSTSDILRDMCDLTNNFISGNESVHDIDTGCAGRRAPQLSFAFKASEIHERLASLPSAHTPNIFITGDWVYEACRIAAIIYTTAIDICVPFSVAANNISSTARRATRTPKTQSVSVELLLKALGRTDMANVWKNMSGVLYWVCAVGAAAARTPATIDIRRRPSNSTQIREARVRLCLIMHATRTMTVLMLEHPVPVLIAQQELLRVQELIASGKET